MPFVKGNTIGQDTRFKTGQSGSPAGRPPVPYIPTLFSGCSGN